MREDFDDDGEMLSSGDGTLSCHADWVPPRSLYSSNAATQEMRFRHLGVDEGLQKSYVNQIGQDVQGYLRIGTRDGLTSHDEG